MNIPANIINPFSDKFVETWDLWKSFRWESHKFKYKGVISEQMALKRLVEVSGGDEEKAVRIVAQSISREWMDFYDLKQPSANGTRKKQQSSAGNSGSTETGTLRERVAKAVNKRYGGGEQATDGTHLKAV